MENSYSTENFFSDFNLSSSLSTHKDSLLNKPNKSNIPKANSIFNKKEIFYVIHKREIVILEPKSNKDSARAIYKCIYCGKKYPTLHRIRSHLRHHVSLFSFINN